MHRFIDKLLLELIHSGVGSVCGDSGSSISRGYISEVLLAVLHAMSGTTQSGQLEFRASRFCAPCQALFTGHDNLRNDGEAYIHSQNIDVVSVNAKAGCSFCVWMETIYSREYHGKFNSKPITFRMQRDNRYYSLYGKAGSKLLDFSLVPFESELAVRLVGHLTDRS